MECWYKGHAQRLNVSQLLFHFMRIHHWYRFLVIVSDDTPFTTEIYYTHQDNKVYKSTKIFALVILFYFPHPFSVLNAEILRIYIFNLI